MTSKRMGILAIYYRRLRAQSVVRTMRDVRNINKVLKHMHRIFAADGSGQSNFYLSSYSRDQEIQFCCELLQCSLSVVGAVFEELESDERFLYELRSRYLQYRSDSRIGLDFGRFKVWYAILRLTQPRIVLETGVHDGLSSVIILHALERNGAGALISVDLPSTDLPPRASGPGWLVPAHLRPRWKLHLGDARALLPAVARANAPIDVFIHDSDHSRAHREFEYRTIQPLLAPTGLLLTDHDKDSELLDELALAWSASHYRVRSTSDPFAGYIGGLAFHPNSSP